MLVDPFLGLTGHTPGSLGLIGGRACTQGRIPGGSGRKVPGGDGVLGVDQGQWRVLAAGCPSGR